MTPDPVPAPTIAAALAWLTLTVSGGEAMTFCTDENGDVGLFVDGVEKARGSGITASEAVEDAHRRYHEAGMARCECEQLERDGDVLWRPLFPLQPTRR